MKKTKRASSWVISDEEFRENPNSRIASDTPVTEAEWRADREYVMKVLAQERRRRPVEYRYRLLGAD